MTIYTAQKWMDQALTLAKQAKSIGEVPVGAIIVKDNIIISSAHNRTIIDNDPCGHAEIIAIKKAAKILENERLQGCDLWVTLEPCAMCAGAIANARIKRLYYGASDPKSGAIEHGPILFSHDIIHHKPEVYAGFRSNECASLLKKFFNAQRHAKHKDA